MNRETGALTGSPRQTGLEKVLALSSLWLWRALSVTIPFITFLFLFGLTALELIPLGPEFGLLLVIVPFIALMATALIKIFPALPPIRRRRAVGGVSTRERMALYALLTLAVIALAIITPTTIERLSRNEDAKAALLHFQIKHDPGVELPSLERTLAEFERARRSLSQEWTIPPEAPPVSLEILQDLETYRQLREEKWSTGFVVCRESGVVIVVPVEAESGVVSEYDRSDTPRHEMAHAMMCQVLGQEAYFSIQLWYHEGLAQFYQYDKLTNLFDRAFNRLDVWWNRERSAAARKILRLPARRLQPGRPALLPDLLGIRSFARRQIRPARSTPDSRRGSRGHPVRHKHETPRGRGVRRPLRRVARESLNPSLAYSAYGSSVSGGGGGPVALWSNELAPALPAHRRGGRAR